MANRVKRFDWFFEHQDGLCLLGLHDACKARARLMTYSRKGKRSGSDATWEHVFPLARRVAGEPQLTVLACAQCNTFKGAADPSPEYVAAALPLARKWFTAMGQASHVVKIEETVAWFLSPPPVSIGATFFPPVTPEEAAQLDDLARQELLAQLDKPARADALGVTDPRYRPGAKRLPGAGR